MASSHSLEDTECSLGSNTMKTLKCEPLFNQNVLSLGSLGRPPWGDSLLWVGVVPVGLG